tara:strand:- start:1331 stop:2191 length:861 start_codon:yes stop_codon:yes gene_type:complete
MPELPEVDVIKQALQKTIINKKINKVSIHNPNLRFKVNKNLEKILINKKILNISRIAKYLVIHFETGLFLIIHFGMSGTLHMVDKKKNINTNLSFYSHLNLPKKHNHVEIFFKNSRLIYNDPRRFGFIKVLNKMENLKKYFKKIGPEPNSKQFNTRYLKRKLNKKEINIKNALLDQTLVSGLGNIYVNEILFYSKIYPLKKSSEISKKFINKIIKYSNFVIKIAIKNGGSSIMNFKNTTGRMGNFQKEFKVYGKDGYMCPRTNCKGKIKKVFISNRSSFYCNICQK